MLRKFVAVVLYTCLSTSAIVAWAVEPEAIEALKADTMRKLVVHKEPKPVSDISFFSAAGEEMSLDALRGEIAIVNFWATWCAPCREEMPSFDALAGEYGAQGLVVLPIATGHNPDAAIERFWKKAGITQLETARDPKSKLARDLGILGLPVTLVLNRDGDEIARLTGDADWHSDSARAIVEALLASTQ